MKELLLSASRYIYRKRREKDNILYDKKICRSHPEWKKLTIYEKNKTRKCDIYAMTIFKNMCGYSKYFVSDELYKGELLPKLNYMNYHSLGIYHCGGGILRTKIIWIFF